MNSETQNIQTPGDEIYCDACKHTITRANIARHYKTRLHKLCMVIYNSSNREETNKEAEYNKNSSK